MNDSTQYIELVERYFDNDMTDEEKVLFMQQLDTDKALRHLFDREKLLINTVRFGAAKNHLTFFKELEKSLPDVTVERKESATWMYYAAAATVLLLVVAGIYMFGNKEATPDELYAEYFAPYPNVFEPTVRGSEEATKRAFAFQKYEEGEYAQAAALFEEITSEKKEPGILLLLGNANLALGKTDAARNNFNDLIQMADSNAAAARWYLSLCYLRDGQLEQAKDTLEVVAKGDDAYSEKARQLINALPK